MKRPILRLVGWVIAVLAVLRLGGELRSAGLEGKTARYGIVSLELARTPDEVNAVLSEWRDAGKLEAAKKNVLLDFPFIVAYVGALLLTLLWSADQVREARRHLWPRAFWSLCCAILVFLAWAQIAAGLLDVLENIGMLRYLDGHVEWTLIQVVWISAAVKFGIVILGLAAFLFTLILWLVLPWRLYLRVVRLGTQPPS